MAFVARADKKSYADQVINQAVPGPGTYLQFQEYQTSKGYAPFMSTAERSKSLKKDEDAPGPGSYNVAFDLTNQTQKLLVSSLNPDPKELEKPKLSNVFKSKSQRFVDKTKKQEDNPGPGSYFQEEEAFGRKIKNIPSGNFQKKEMIQNVLKMNKYLSIPSIPSNVHGYGYTENDTHELILNKNPLVEAYRLVGPGYYNPKDGFEVVRPKGISWHRSGTKRFVGNNQKRSITADGIGPGSYELNSQVMPLYKLKQSSGFASTTRRTLDSKVKQPFNQAKSIMNRSYQSGINQGQEGEEPLDMEEYIDNSTPGPGYYHNESNASSIKLSYKPERLQFFGTSAQRFKEIDSRGNTLGPGDYDIGKDPNGKIKKGGKMPFALSNGRFDKQRIFKTPGPGSYDPKMNLKDSLETKVKHGYQGNFGTTDRRFKANAQLEELPGPGTYLQVVTEGGPGAKLTSVFASGSKREAYTVRNDAPAPNTYNLENLTLARAIIKEEDEDPELMPKREPFNSSQVRFKALQKEPEAEDPQKFSRTAEAYAKSKMKPKQSAAFAATKRAELNKAKDGPSPGSYYDPNNNQWNKRTYNILFAEV